MNKASYRGMPLDSLIFADGEKEPETICVEDYPVFAYAPVLLKACKDLLAEMSGSEKSCGHQYTCVCPSDKAREIIKEIEGF